MAILLNEFEISYAMSNEKCAKILSTYQYTTKSTDKHPQGIELRITVTPKSFDSSDEIEIVPHRGANPCSPIKSNVVE